MKLPNVWQYHLKETPKAQSRHRCRVWRGRVLTYDPCAKDKKRIAALIRQQMSKQNTQMIADKPVSINVCFYLYHAKKKPGCYKRPDLDNLIKFILDATIGVLFADDAQVCRLLARKVYVDKKEDQRTFLAVWEMRDEDETD